MGLPIIVVGSSGSGKTYSIKGMRPDTVGVFLCEKNRLPFKKKFKTYKVKNMITEDGKIIRQAAVITTLLKKPNLKRYVIDDSQYIMANEFFDRAGEQGYQKFTDIGVHFRDLIHTVNNELPDDVIVYFLHHPEQDVNTGMIKAKTIGKMLDEKLTLEGCFDIVLRCETNGTEHWFVTQSNGMDTTKSPEGMFEMKIPNDLSLVDRKVREYYGMDVIDDGEDNATSEG